MLLSALHASQLACLELRTCEVSLGRGLSCVHRLWVSAGSIIPQGTSGCKNSIQKTQLLPRTMATNLENSECRPALTEEYAQQQDVNDASLRHEFNIPTRGDLKRKRIRGQQSSHPDDPNDLLPSTYLCGNSLGLQPKRTREYIESYLSTWSSLGVYGHFKPLEDQYTEPWVDIDDQAKDAMSKIVGALPSEVAVMQTLTANLHLLLASFYRPSKERWKIIIESKAFPSDHVLLTIQLSILQANE